jgi:hypothetical protein
VAASGLVACGSGGGEGSSAGDTAQAESTSTTVAAMGPFGPCRDVPKPRSVADPLPPEVPLPPGTYQTGTATPLLDGRSYRELSLVAPVDLDALAQYVVTEWPRAGVVRGWGERELGELETSFLAGNTGGALIARQTFCDTGVSEVLLAMSDPGQTLNFRPQQRTTTAQSWPPPK